MEKIEFDKYIKQLKHFTKKNENTWFVQKHKDSYMESFYVTILPHGLCMSGDYDGVIVNPGIGDREELIRWMANATSLSYFAEKVRLGNQYHKYNEYTEKSGEISLIDLISAHCDAEGFEDLLKEQLWSSKINDEQFKENLRNKIVEIDKIPVEDVDEKQLDKLLAVRNTVAYHSLENECEYWELCRDLESEHGFSDLWEFNSREYTSQLIWQHKCLLWWANNVIDKQDKESFEVEQKTSPIPLTDKSVSILGGIL